MIDALNNKTAAEIEAEAFVKMVAFHGGNAAAAGRTLGFGKTKVLEMTAKYLKK